jgi:ABC-type multidrug transport system permease subunit
MRKLKFTKNQLKQIEKHTIAYQLFRLIIAMTLSSTSIYVLSLGGTIFICEGAALLSAMSILATNGCVQIHQDAFTLLFWYLKNYPIALGIPTGVVINILLTRFQKSSPKNRAAKLEITNE